MNRHIIYTYEGYTEAPDGSEINNCQMLGIAPGKDKKEAIDILFAEHQQLEAIGFTKEKCVALLLKDDIITY